LLQVDDQEPCRILAPGRDPMAAPAAATSDSPALLHQYTSGSTGKPNRVIRTHAHLTYELERLATVFELGEDDRFLGAAPFTHVNGLVRSMMTSMFVGATLYPVRDFHRRQVLDLIARERVSYFGAVPQMFAILADTPTRGVVDLSSLRTIFSASAPLLPADNRRFRERYGHWIRQLYGSTETGTISVNRSPDVESCLESVGTPLPGVSFRTVDDRGTDVTAGAEGEVAIASPSAIRGYDQNPEATAAAFRDGEYLSGDLGRLASDGSLTLTGRKKFLINRGGFKVNPLEVEEAIASHPKVREVAVVGAPGLHGDDVVRCVIVPGEPCSAEEIVQHCGGLIADYKIPSRIEFRDSLPRTDTGKLLRHQL
jgi:long-chain acyl-CoA synthetase